ncbi:MAG: hypothetical protein JNK05_37520 [Myxococcales bacterium]|nr:hypothetical protein [Myxococcales bacterium]
MTAGLDPTGGLRYHLRARRYRTTLWAPFARAVSRWLATWNPPERELLLVGPSGGYCLDLVWLSRFERVTVLEIDPLARWIFARRVKRAFEAAKLAPPSLAFDRRDHLSPRAGRFVIEPLRALLEEHTQSSVLFCNILGQLPLLGPDPPEQLPDPPPEGSYERWLAQLVEALEGHSWASFHDRLSGTIRPRAELSLDLSPWRSSEALVADLYAETTDETAVLEDHRTSALAPKVPRAQMLWQLDRGVFHLIEALSITRD